MSLSLAIALNVLADAGIVAALAYVMSRPAQLREHGRPVAPVVRLQRVHNDAEHVQRAA